MRNDISIHEIWASLGRTTTFTRQPETRRISQPEIAAEQEAAQRRGVERRTRHRNERMAPPYDGTGMAPPSAIRSNGTDCCHRYVENVGVASENVGDEIPPDKLGPCGWDCRSVRVFWGNSLADLRFRPSWVTLAPDHVVLWYLRLLGSRVCSVGLCVLFGGTVDKRSGQVWGAREENRFCSPGCW